MYSLKDYKSIIIKGADKVAAVIVWDQEDYLTEVSKELEDKVYLEVKTVVTNGSYKMEVTNGNRWLLPFWKLTFKKGNPK